MAMGIKNVKISRKILYFTGVNERSLGRGESLFGGLSEGEYRRVRLLPCEEKARESVEYFVKVVAFPKARLHVCARSTVSS